MSDDPNAPLPTLNPARFAGDADDIEVMTQSEFDKPTAEQTALQAKHDEAMARIRQQLLDEEGLGT